MRRHRILFALGTLICGVGEARAQLPAGELRLWLKADSLNLSEDARVTQWVDSSPYGTIFAPRTTSEPDGPLAGGPVEEYPHFVSVNVNGNTFRTVQFERNGDIHNAGNPAIDRSGSVDRLFQVNNRSQSSDPLIIGDGTSVTSFTVLMPNTTTSGALGFQSVWALRGNLASLLELGIRSSGHYNYVTYDSLTDYHATNPAVAGKWQIVAQTILEAGANDQLRFFVNDTENAASPLVQNPTLTNGGLIANRNDVINNDPTGLAEPFAIGGHAQDCCGEGETFSGNIAEIILYARALSSAETSQVYSYLTAKYLSPASALPGDYNQDQIVDAGDYVVWRDNVGQFFALPNENSFALTEGFVDEEDYEFWRDYYGTTAGSSFAKTTVPEPSGFARLLFVAAFTAYSGRRLRNSPRALQRTTCKTELHVGAP
jgi:hypothetical protein